MASFMHYVGGEVAKVGDQVSYDGELSVVEEVIDEKHLLLLEGIVSEPGLMLTNRRDGRVFVPAEIIDQYKLSDCLFLVRRHTPGTSECETDESDD